MKYLVTGAAGFIGYHVTQCLLASGHEVVGLDNLNDYYSVLLKQDRLAQLNHPNFSFHRIELSDHEAVYELFQQNQFEKVIHLAAQAGVRYSLTNPYAYTKSNVDGFLSILEACRHQSSVKHLVYASSSSVYGCNHKLPFSVRHNVDHPISLYAATKKSNELMAHSYSHLYNLPTTGLRFFTVYGPWGRPDMALFKFTEAILQNRPIDVFNHGKMLRDFTYIDDIVQGVVKIADVTPQQTPDLVGKELLPNTSHAPYRIYNIGNNQPVELEKFIQVLEQSIGKEAQRNYLEIQPGDVPATFADIDDLFDAVGFKPQTPIEQGIRQFVDWYTGYYRV